MMDLDWTNNLAVGKPASQSSTALGRFAREAVDGNRDMPNFTSCSRTALEANPWWQVDLGAVYQIKKVVVMDIMMRCGTYMNDSRVSRICQRCLIDDIHVLECGALMLL